MSNKNEISFYGSIDNPMEAISEIGNYFTASGMFGCTKKEQGAVLAMACLCEGSNPLEIAKRYYIIEGRLTKKYETLLAEFYNEGGKVEWKERTDEVVEAEFIHPENGRISLKLTMKEMLDKGIAKTSGGKIKDNYKKFPRQMLTSKLVREAINLVAPHITVGVYTPEEVADFTDRDVKLGEILGGEKEADARTLSDDSPTPPPPEDLFPTKSDRFTDVQIREINNHADAVNAYLVQIGWISEGETWEYLNSGHKSMMINKFDSFMDKCLEREGDK